jgi:mono/diheme cytochrome c family protein
VDGRFRVLKSVGWWLILLLGVCSVAAAQQNGKAPAGAATFKTKCVLCHGADGAGSTPLGKQLQAANLRSKEVQKRSDAELHKIVHDGEANMPPFGEQLTDAEIDQVIQYVRELAKPAKTAKKQ